MFFLRVKVNGIVSKAEFTFFVIRSVLYTGSSLFVCYETLVLFVLKMLDLWLLSDIH